MSRHHARLHAGRWAATRLKVFRRDGWRCRECGKAGRLECDHIVPLEVEPEQNPYNSDGCQTLCRSCHIKKTSHENRREPLPAEAAWQAMVDDLAARS